MDQHLEIGLIGKTLLACDPLRQVEVIDRNAQGNRLRRRLLARGKVQANVKRNRIGRQQLEVVLKLVLVLDEVYPIGWTKTGCS